MILVVDDELDILRLAETVLRQAGHPVTAARSADAAISVIPAASVIRGRIVRLFPLTSSPRP